MCSSLGFAMSIEVTYTPWRSIPLFTLCRAKGLSGELGRGGFAAFYWSEAGVEVVLFLVLHP